MCAPLSRFERVTCHESGYQCTRADHASCAVRCIRCPVSGVCYQVSGLRIKFNPAAVAAGTPAITDAYVLQPGW